MANEKANKNRSIRFGIGITRNATIFLKSNREIKMQLSDGERLIAVMLADLMQALEVNREVDPALIKTLICNHDDWALKWQYPGIFDGEPPSDAVIKETTDILAMWSFIEYSIGKLDGDEADEAKNFLHTQFSGFDGNHDPHHHVAHTLIHDLNRFAEFKDRGLNSHSQATLPRYREMLPQYHAAMDGRMGQPLTFDELNGLLN